LLKWMRKNSPHQKEFPLTPTSASSSPAAFVCVVDAAHVRRVPYHSDTELYGEFRIIPYGEFRIVHHSVVSCIMFRTIRNAYSKRCSCASSVSFRSIMYLVPHHEKCLRQALLTHGEFRIVLWYHVSCSAPSEMPTASAAHVRNTATDYRRAKHRNGLQSGTHGPGLRGRV
jgi:hypothetical protein